jgi:two-component system response regulator
MNQTEIEILLVEDNMNDAELTIRALSKSKIANHLVHVKDGASALEFLFGTGEFEGRNVSNLPKLILLDLKMPKVDGIEVLRIIKSNELTKKIPVVVLTSSRENPDIKHSYELGANSYIVKPVDFDGFMKAVTEIGCYWLLHNQQPL